MNSPERSSFAVSSRAVCDSVVHSLLLTADRNDQSLLELECKCKAYLLESGRSSPLLHTVLEEYDKSKAKRSSERKEKKIVDIIQDTFDIHSVKVNLDINHTLRFTVVSPFPTSAFSSTYGSKAGGGINTNSNESTPKGSGVGGTDSSNSFLDGSAKALASLKSDYEDIISPTVLTAPICDICIVRKGDPTPKGYYRISRTMDNKKANLNIGSGGDVIYLCIKKDLTGNAVPITSIVMFYPDKAEYLPPGFSVIRMNNRPCNLAMGSRSELTDRIFLAVKKIKGGNPLTDLQVLLPLRGEEVPQGFNLLTSSPTGFDADCNFGTDGAPRVLLCYRQVLPKLECLLKDVADLGDVSRNRRASSAPPTVPLTESSITSHSSSADQNTDVQINFEDSRSEDAILSSMGDSKGGDSGKFEDEFYEEKESDEILALNQRIASKSAVLYAEGVLVPKLTRSALFTILSALYCRFENVSTIAMNGLIKLLTETDFYENDIKSASQTRHLTLLDMTLDALCDRFDICNENEFDPLLQFFRLLISRSNGCLSCTILQRIYRVVTFLSQYFSCKTNWFISEEQMPTGADGMELPVFKVMKDLVKMCHIQVEQPRLCSSLSSGQDSSNNSLASFSSNLAADSSNYFSNSNTSHSNSSSPGPILEEKAKMEPLADIKESTLIVKDIVRELFDEVVECVELHRITEHLLVIINKQHVTINSAIFWQEMNSSSKRLFKDENYRNAFLVLAVVCKSSWIALPGDISQSTVLANTHSGREKARELGSKLLALEALYEFCFWAGEKMQTNRVMGYLIRRLVVPCLLFNVNYAFSDVRVFSKLLKVFTALWKVWRTHIRLEFAILCENLVIRVLNAGQNAKPIYQMLVIQEVVSWFDQPYLMIEMFVNYDMDYRFVSNWNIFSHLVRSICGIARKANSNYRQSRDGNPNAVTFDLVNILALEQVCRISKTLMDASGHAHLIKKDSNFRARNALYGGGGWDRPVGAGDKGDKGDKEGGPGLPDGTPSSDSATNAREGNRRKSVVTMKRDLHEEAEGLIAEAIRIYKEKESVKKAINFLVSKGFITDTPPEIASFLRVYKNSFDPTAIGDFLGEGGVKQAEIEYYNAIRFRYIRVVSFLDMSLEPALRLFLTGCGFRLPGEAQKIDRLVEIFVKVFWQDNHGTSFCPFHSEDAIHLVSFAIIMLNTDLHRANSDTKKGGKKYNKMTKDQFINNLRGINNGENVEREYLSLIYDNIFEKPIALAFDSSERLKVVHQPKGESRLSTLGGVANFLSREQSAVNSEGIDEKSFILEVTRGLRDSEDLLRSLSVYNYKFQLTGAEEGGANISLDLVSFMYETVWFHFQAVTESILTTKTTDVHILDCALDVSSHSITSSLFLDLLEEKTKLTSMLFKFQNAVVRSDSYKRIASSASFDDTWKAVVDRVSPESAMEGITKVHKMVAKLKVTLLNIRIYDELFEMASKTDDKDEIMLNNTKFIFDGDMLKKNRSGSLTEYRFFLFSNWLVYAHTSITGEFKVHQKLDIENVFVTDPRPDECSFIINHPNKSFIVIAPSVDTKNLWLRHISETKDDLRWSKKNEKSAS